MSESSRPSLGRNENDAEDENGAQSQILQDEVALGSHSSTHHNSGQIRRNIAANFKQLKLEASSAMKQLNQKLASAISPAISTQNQSPQFGVPLLSVRLIEGLPVVVAQTIDYLTTNCLDLVGIFRIPGSALEIKRIRDMYDSGESVNLFAEGDQALFKTPHTVAALLKLFLRELPEPLLTFDLYDCFIAGNSIELPDARLHCIKKLLMMLPKVNLRLLMHLIIFLRAVDQMSDVNKMPASNLGLVFAPNVLRPRSDELSVCISDSPHAIKILETLITDFDVLFNDVDFADDYLDNQSIANIEVDSGTRAQLSPVEKLKPYFARLKRMNEKIQSTMAANPTRRPRSSVAQTENSTTLVIDTSGSIMGDVQPRRKNSC